MNTRSLAQPWQKFCLIGRKSAISTLPDRSSPHLGVVESAITLAAKRLMVLNMTDMAATILAVVAMTRNMLVHAPHLLVNSEVAFHFCCC